MNNKKIMKNQFIKKRLKSGIKIKGADLVNKEN